MKRREFIKNTCTGCAVVGVGLLLGSNFLSSCSSSKMTVSKTKAIDGKAIIPLDSMVDGSVKIVRVANYNFDIALKRNGTDCKAIVMMCSHAGHPLVRTGDGFFCTLHGSHFSGNGAVETGPASKPLMQLPVAINNNQIEITLLTPTL